MANNNIVFLEKWYEDLINDEFSPLSAEEFAYILYAATMYEWTGEKTNFAEVFNRGDLNRVMAVYYPQIDSIKNYKVGMKVDPVAGHQSYDNEAIKALAAKGLSQKEICRQLGYDESRSRSLSTNRGYREGREIFLKGGICGNGDTLSPYEASIPACQSESQKVRSSDNLTQKVSQSDSESKKLLESQKVRKVVSLSESKKILQTESESQSESKNAFEF